MGYDAELGSVDAMLASVQDELTESITSLYRLKADLASRMTSRTGRPVDSFERSAASRLISLSRESAALLEASRTTIEESRLLVERAKAAALAIEAEYGKKR